ncbi:hypothetical protein P2G42_06940 [Klebsiella electrica]|uniref:hypothetical protein n=1 Tax=Klebsiella electrica TaxID=1259973 RepID=UPI002552AFA4|nr:hypothetical protein [Klebsiella electrica]WIO44358.1 hypothetical protein P2G42_06940 [Klebsiella electrica]
MSALSGLPDCTPCSPGQRSATGGYFQAPAGNHPDGGVSALSGLPDFTPCSPGQRSATGEIGCR